MVVVNVVEVVLIVVVVDDVIAVVEDAVVVGEAIVEVTSDASVGFSSVVKMYLIFNLTIVVNEFQIFVKNIRT